MLTANHCIETPTVAATATSIWFYESTACDDNTPSPNRVQVSGGMQLVFTSFNVDSTLLQMNTPPPSGSIFSPVNAALVNPGTNVVSISHPRGDTQRWATGSTGALERDNERPYDMYSVNLTRGIIEGGSSGSGLFAAQGGRLVLRGILSQGAINLSCEQPSLFTLYGRLEAFYPMISQYIGVTGTLPDDTPNRPQDVTATISPVPVDTGGELVFPNRRIDYAGDVDIFKFTIVARSAVSAYTRGDMDTVGTLLDSTESRSRPKTMRNAAIPTRGSRACWGRARTTSASGTGCPRARAPTSFACAPTTWTRTTPRSGGTRPNRAGASTWTTRATSCSPRCSITTLTARRRGW